MYGAKVLIFGPPNSGKSSLFNYLSREEKAITSDEAGTTTDQNFNTLEICGIRAIISDTAGLRKTKRKIEKIGVERTNLAISQNNKFILVCLPGALTKKAKLIDSALEKINLKQTIIVFNKSDLKILLR